jgi:hypothetical protein
MSRAGEAEMTGADAQGGGEAEKGRSPVDAGELRVGISAGCEGAVRLGCFCLDDRI